MQKPPRQWTWWPGGHGSSQRQQEAQSEKPPKLSCWVGRCISHHGKKVCSCPVPNSG